MEEEDGVMGYGRNPSDLGLQCGNCLGTSFSEDEQGFMFCLICGVQSQDYIAESQELEDGRSMVRRRLKVAKPSLAAMTMAMADQANARAEMPSERENITSFQILESFQAALQVMMTSFMAASSVNLVGCNEMSSPFKVLVKDIWFSYLKALQSRGFNVLTYFMNPFEKQPDEERERRRLKTSLKTYLPEPSRPLLLAILYIASRFLRLPLLVSDFLNMVKSGEIPYLKVFNFISKPSLQPCIVHMKRFFKKRRSLVSARSKSYISHSDITDNADMLTALLSLTLPPMNKPLVALRLLIRCGLVKEVSDHSYRGSSVKKGKDKRSSVGEINSNNSNDNNENDDDDNDNSIWESHLNDEIMNKPSNLWRIFNQLTCMWSGKLAWPVLSVFSTNGIIDGAGSHNEDHDAEPLLAILAVCCKLNPHWMRWRYVNYQQIGRPNLGDPFGDGIGMRSVSIKRSFRDVSVSKSNDNRVSGLVNSSSSRNNNSNNKNNNHRNSNSDSDSSDSIADKSKSKSDCSRKRVKFSGFENVAEINEVQSAESDTARDVPHYRSVASLRRLPREQLSSFLSQTRLLLTGENSDRPDVKIELSADEGGSNPATVDKGEAVMSRTINRMIRHTLKQAGIGDSNSSSYGNPNTNSNSRNNNWGVGSSSSSSDNSNLMVVGGSFSFDISRYARDAIINPCLFDPTISMAATGSTSYGSRNSLLAYDRLLHMPDLRIKLPATSSKSRSQMNGSKAADERYEEGDENGYRRQYLSYSRFDNGYQKAAGLYHPQYTLLLDRFASVGGSYYADQGVGFNASFIHYYISCLDNYLLSDFKYMDKAFRAAYGLDKAAKLGMSLRSILGRQRRGVDAYATSNIYPKANKRAYLFSDFECLYSNQKELIKVSNPLLQNQRLQRDIPRNYYQAAESGEEDGGDDGDDDSDDNNEVSNYFTLATRTNNSTLNKAHFEDGRSVDDYTVMRHQMGLWMPLIHELATSGEVEADSGGDGYARNDDTDLFDDEGGNTTINIRKSIGNYEEEGKKNGGNSSSDSDSYDYDAFGGNDVRENENNRQSQFSAFAYDSDSD